MVYTDFDISSIETIRTFSESIDPAELMWHRDLEARQVIAVEPSDWQLQLENMLPFSLNKTITIPAGTWHRLIKGTGNLIIKIKKKNEST